MQEVLQWVPFPVGPLSSYIGQLSLASLRDYGKSNRVPACLAGVKAGHIHLCRVAGNTAMCDPIYGK